jgi:hypothetical protein
MFAKIHDLRKVFVGVNRISPFSWLTGISPNTRLTRPNLPCAGIKSASSAPHGSKPAATTRLLKGAKAQKRNVTSLRDSEARRRKVRVPGPLPVHPI